MFAGFDRQQLEVDGLVINYVIGGSGPALLMLHGFPQNLAMWARVAPLLAEQFTVVCSDLRGYGDSYKPAASADYSNYSFRAMAEDQVGLMQRLGFTRFHVVGHDRGGRTGHRLALDHPEVVQSLTVMDIVPTHTMFMATNHLIANAYWHWYFLAQPAPLAERLIASDPDFFYENCLAGWGATQIRDFDQEMLGEYRRCWRKPDMIRGSCADYRAAALIDLALDDAQLGQQISCPTLAFWGANGLMHKLFDIAAEWRKRCVRLQTASLPGGHFFVDQYPDKTAGVLRSFLLSTTT